MTHRATKDQLSHILAGMMVIPLILAMLTVTPPAWGQQSNGDDTDIDALMDPIVEEQVVEQPPVEQEQPEPRQPITRDNGRLILNFQDASISAVLSELSEAAGYIVVKEVQPVGRVTLVSRQPVDADEAVALLNTVLRNAGYAAIRQDRILKIVRATDAKRQNIPVRVGNDPAQIALTDELITQVIPLRYADATQLRQDLQPLINTDADFASNQSSNALVITDTSANVRRVVEIVRALDTSIADAVDVRLFQLKFANAGTAARLINDVFANIEVAGTQQQQQDQIPPWLRRGGQQGGPGGQDQRQQQTGGRTTVRVSASSDERTNSVIVSGPSDTLLVIAKVIEELDSNPAEDETVFVYRLRNAQALNVESVLNSLFNNTAPGTRSTPQTLDQLRQGGTTARASRAAGGSTIGGGGTLGQGGTRAGTGFTQQQTTGGATGARGVTATAQQTANDLAGLVTIIADTDTNSLLVRTSPVNYPRVREVIEELDKAVPQVLIKVLIAEVTHDDGIDFGTELSILNIRDSGLGQEAGTGFNIPLTGPSATGLIIQVLERDFSATIRALETAGKLDVLSRPYILASDNQLASITIGQEIPFITNSRITDTGQTINTIEYGDVGILLDVVPHINPDGLVILDVAPEISTLTGTTVPISELVSSPVIAKRSAQSRVAVRDGQTVVIGGLMEDRVTQSVDKVPLLGDIPILGHAFKRTRQNKSKTELLIFLTPHVASTPDILQEMSDKELDATKLVPGAVKPGVFDEHRAGMIRGVPPEAETDNPQ